MLVDKRLDRLVRQMLQLNCFLGIHFLDFVQSVDADVVVPDVLEDFAGQLATFVPHTVNEVAKIPSSASCGAVVISAWHGSVVARFDHLIRIGRCSLLL